MADAHDSKSCTARCVGSTPTSGIIQIGTDYIGITTPFYCHDGRGNFLLHRRSKNCRDERGRWDPGSGKLEFGINPEENVLKEVIEEYGCGGVIDGTLPPHGIFRTQNGVRTHWLAVPFFVKIRRNDAKLNESHKMLEIGWFQLKKLPKPHHTGFSFTLKKFRKYFNKYEK